MTRTRDDTMPPSQKLALRRAAELLSHIPNSWRISMNDISSPMSVTVPRTCVILTPRELLITESKALTILEEIRSRAWTAVEVTLAFCKRAAIAHQLVNCVADTMFEEALSRAEELDLYMEIHGKPVGPLHGLPISVKEHIHVKGTRTTCGLIIWADEVSTQDAHVVDILRRQGAIFHVKTTNAQLAMELECDSNLFGRTLNPYNANLTCGGSSGGEGALIGLRGSVLGIGTDIGGSIRIPAGFCGVYGLKPSVARLPHEGLAGPHTGMHNIIGSVGPLAAHAADLRLFCQTILQDKPWDREPSLIERPWMKSVRGHSKLRIAVLWHDGVVAPHPPVQRALRDLVSLLEKDGHSIITWKPDYHRELVELVDKAYFLDGGKEYWDLLEAGNEEPVPIMKWLLDTKATRHYSVAESWKINNDIDNLRTKYLSQWLSSEADIILSPTHSSVACAHDQSKHWGYTSVFNGLDYSAVAFPAGTVRASDTWENFPPVSRTPMSEVDVTYREFFDEGGPEKYKDAPISLQLVARRLREEDLLHALDVVERAMQGP